MIDLEQQSDQTSTEATQSNETSSPEQAPDSSQQASAVFDLNKAEKFNFEGKEYTLKDLREWRKSDLRQADYTKKTQELSNREKNLRETFEKEYEPYKKYSGENLIADLMKVKQSPSLINQFLKIYPKEYHSALEMIGIKPEQPQSFGGLDPETQSKIDKFLEYGSKVEQREQEALNAQIDSTLKEMQTKYKYVDEEHALAKLEYIANQKGDLTKEDYEQVYKSLNDRATKLSESIYSEKVNVQKNKNKAAADVPNGGGVPGIAPKQVRTLKEAEAQARQALGIG